MLQIVVPMAGRGSRFATAGYTLPKPLIPVNGVPMIQLVIANLRPRPRHRVDYLGQPEHLDAVPLASTR
ncbi:MAG: glycosyl transferase family 2, partial [Planctomycetia bacterium]